MSLPTDNTMPSCPACYADFAPSRSLCKSCGANGDYRWLGYVIDRLPYPSYPPVVRVEPSDALIEKMLALRGWLSLKGDSGIESPYDLAICTAGGDAPIGLRHDGFAIFTSARTEKSDTLGEVVTVTPQPVLHAAPMRRWAIELNASVLIARPRHPGYPLLPAPAWAALRSNRRWPEAGGQSDQVGDAPPVFVIGAPRSGTTYLGKVLGRHSDIFLTNETRMMILFSRLLTQLCTDEWALLGHATAFVDHLDASLPGLIRSFYESLGAKKGQRWGDKYPHYADMRSHPHALVSIDRMFPEAQFVHIIRDPREVVQSITRKGWLPEPQAWDVWARHVIHAREFGRVIGPERFFEVRYEDLISDGIGTITPLFDFLRLPPEPAVTDFLNAQASERTPFSLPMTDLASLDEKSADQSPGSEIPEDMTTLLAQTNYET